MATEITQRELRNDSGDVMRRLDQGEIFIVTRNGVPVGELTPIRRRRAVAKSEALAALRGARPVDYADLRADLDAIANQDTAPRG
jgi:prevent-host-death family protein